MLTAAEQSALQAARLQFLSWWSGMEPLRPKVLADLRQAARAMSVALSELGAGNPTEARLLVRMQVLELHQSSQERYRQLLNEVAYVASLVDRALEEDVQRGQKIDARVRSWVCYAAQSWRAAGLPVRPAGRFGKALASFAGQGVPHDVSLDQVRSTLAALGTEGNAGSIAAVK